MIHINIRKSVSAILFSMAASMLSCYGDHWTEADPICNDINNELFGERHVRIDVDGLDNAFTKSYIEKTKETTLSVNGKAFWISSKANPGEPKDIAYFSSKGIKNWELGLSPDKTEFVMKNVEGILWAVSKAGDLYTFVNGTDGTYQFQKDPSIKDVRYVYSGFDGDVWVLAEKPGAKLAGLQIYHLIDGTWKLNPGKGMVCLAVTDKNTVYALSTLRKLYKWDEAKNKWVYMTMAIGAKDIRSGPNGDLWQVSLIGTTSMWTGKKWEPMGGAFVDNIAVGKVRTYGVMSYKLGRTPHKFAFDLLAIGDLQKVHVRPSQIIDTKAEKAKAKAEKDAPKKAGEEKTIEKAPKDKPIVPVESNVAKTEDIQTKEEVTVKKEALVTKKTMPDKKDIWQRFYAVDRPRAFENYYCVSACKNGVVVASRTPDGQIFLSINGKIVWWNKYADQKRNEPSLLVNFSAGAVTDWDISYTGGSIFPQTTIKGTVYGVCAVDVKKPNNKRLYTFEKGNGGGYYWKLDGNLIKPAKMVCAANDGSVIVLCNDGPYQKAVDGSWNKLGTIKNLKQVAVGNKDAIFALSAKDEVLTWKNNTWIPLQKKNPKSNIRHIAVNPQGVLYCTDTTGKASYFSDSQIWVLLPKISNAQQITVMDKEYCWTSQPYGNAMVKNDIIGKVIKAGEIAILRTGALAASVAGAAGVLGIGATAVGVAGIAAASGTVVVGEVTVGATASTIITAVLVSPVAIPTGLIALALAPMALVVGSAIVIPVITIGTLSAAALFGVTALLSRPHCNKIFVRNSDAPENAPDETAPEISTTPVAPAATASTTVQEAAPETATPASTAQEATVTAPAAAPVVPVAPVPVTAPAITEPEAPAAAPAVPVVPVVSVAPTPAQTPTTPKASTVYTGYGNDL